mmetsp:Transcript_96697/g.189920  ORF Transcript_96697/g.189920 Transcript_96697/m.189920 type:complete len:356 (-) Transcript_96697:222-1289(-)
MLRTMAVPMALACDDPIALHIVLLGVFREHLHHLCVLAHGDEVVLGILNDVDRPAKVRPHRQGDRRYVFIQVDAVGMGVGQDRTPSRLDENGRHRHRHASVDESLLGGMREDLAGRRWRPIDPGRGNLSFQAKGVQGGEAALREPRKAHLIGFQRPAHDAVRVGPRVVPSAQQVVRVSVSPFVNVPGGVRRVAMVPEVIDDDVHADRAQHVSEEDIAEIIRVFCEAVLDHDAGWRPASWPCLRGRGHVPSGQINDFRARMRPRTVCHQSARVFLVERLHPAEQILRITWARATRRPLRDAANRPRNAGRQTIRRVGGAVPHDLAVVNRDHAADRGLGHDGDRPDVQQHGNCDSSN